MLYAYKSSVCCDSDLQAMQHPRKYFKSYILGFFPLFFMIVSVITVCYKN
jgi:hypothetical protein